MNVLIVNKWRVYHKLALIDVLVILDLANDNKEGIEAKHLPHISKESDRNHVVHYD